MSWHPCKCLYPIVKYHGQLNSEWCVRCGGKVEAPVVPSPAQDKRGLMGTVGTAGRPRLVAQCISTTLGVDAFSVSALVEKPKRKCRLEDCDELTSHNGGYCCAVHCRVDQERQRGKRGKGKR